MYLITGGAGFIGSYVACEIERRGLGPIVICDWLETGDKWRNLAKREIAQIVPPEHLFDYLTENQPRFTAVIHMGAISDTLETDGDRMMDTNFRFSLKLWDWCAETGTRLIYASSAATYGDGSDGFADDNGVEKLAGLRPLNLYGWSKHLFDRQVARRITEERPTPPQWAGLKFFNVYGPNEYHKGRMQSVAAQIYPTIAGGKPARLFKSHRPGYPDGGQERDFIFVADCAEVILWLLETPAVRGIFNLGTGRARSFTDLAGAVFAAVGTPPDIEYFDMPDDIREKYQYHTQADMSRLRKAGYQKPFTELEEGVARYVEDYLSRLDPYC